jgi:hypothetical protein
MRLSAPDIAVRVSTIPESTRPIRLRAAGLVFALAEAEALDLANKLADAVDELHAHEREEPQP